MKRPSVIRQEELNVVSTFRKAIGDLVLRHIAVRFHDFHTCYKVRLPHYYPHLVTVEQKKLNFFCEDVIRKSYVTLTRE